MIVTGSFDNWTQSAVLSPSSQGHSASVHIPVEKTLFKFVVDGEWKVDESFATETDEHGNVNNVLTEEVLEGYEGDIQEITKDVPGAFPIVSEADDGEGDGTVAKEGDGNVSKTVSGVSGPSGAVSGASGAALGALGASGAVLGASSTSHDLKPSHLDPSAESQLSSTLETKKEAVSGGGFVPAAAESAIPAGSISINLVQIPVPSLAYHRKHPLGSDFGEMLGYPQVTRSVDGSDRMAISNQHGKRQNTRLIDHRSSSQLAVAVERKRSCGTRFSDAGFTARQNRSHPGFSAARGERSVAHFDAWNVRDGVEFAWFSVQRNVEVSGSHGGGGRWCHVV